MLSVTLLLSSCLLSCTTIDSEWCFVKNWRSSSLRKAPCCFTPPSCHVRTEYAALTWFKVGTKLDSREKNCHIFNVLLYESGFTLGWLCVGNEGKRVFVALHPFYCILIPVQKNACNVNMMQSFLLMESWPLFPCRCCKGAHIGLYNLLDELWIFACTGVWFKRSCQQLWLTIQNVSFLSIPFSCAD